MPPIVATPRRLRRADLPVDTATLARYLIGKTLVHEHPEGRLAGRIVETEAYVVGDAAGHAFIGRTQRNKSLFLSRGHAYVYFVYGCWFALNVSAERDGAGAGVLLRACMTLREGRAGSPPHLTSIAASMASTCAAGDSCGWAPPLAVPRASGSVPASACPGRSTVS